MTPLARRLLDALLPGPARTGSGVSHPDQGYYTRGRTDLPFPQIPKEARYR